MILYCTVDYGLILMYDVVFYDSVEGIFADINTTVCVVIDSIVGDLTVCASVTNIDSINIPIYYVVIGLIVAA